MSPNNRPIVIAIEGPDGVGKTTHVRAAVEHLRAQGIEARAFHHTKPDTDDPVEAARIYAQQRCDLVDGLTPGDVVVADGWNISTWAHGLTMASDVARAMGDVADDEGYGEDIPKGHFDAYIGLVILDAPDEVLDARLASRGESLPDGRHRERGYYRLLSSYRNIDSFDASPSDATARTARCVAWVIEGVRMGFNGHRDTVGMRWRAPRAEEVRVTSALCGSPTASALVRTPRGMAVAEMTVGPHGNVVGRRASDSRALASAEVYLMLGPDGPLPWARVARMLAAANTAGAR